MGRILCHIHGEQAFEEVCEHLWDELAHDVFAVMKAKSLPVLGTKLCSNCYQNHKLFEIKELSFEDLLALPEEAQIEWEEKLGAVYDKLKRKVKCIECINHLKIIAARKSGKPLPFEPYENTLLYKDQDKIEELETLLLANYDFQYSQIPYIKTHKACFLSSGSITYPFSIHFYYVTSQSDQNKLLSLIDDFFAMIPQKQRKISFYEAENWIVLDEGNRRNEHRGEEKLLREKIVK